MRSSSRAYPRAWLTNCIEGMFSLGCCCVGCWKNTFPSFNCQACCKDNQAKKQGCSLTPQVLLKCLDGHRCLLALGGGCHGTLGFLPPGFIVTLQILLPKRH